MPLNHHGYRYVETTGTHGIDIASQRMDDLDKGIFSAGPHGRSEP